LTLEVSGVIGLEPPDLFLALQDSRS